MKPAAPANPGAVPVDTSAGSPGRPPGPDLVTFGRLAARHARNHYTLLPEIARRYGDVVNLPVPLPGWTITLVSHPDHVDHIMTRHHQRYVKHEATRELVTGEPPALPLLEGEEWKRTRRPLNPHFGERALAAVTPRMVEAISERVDLWAAREGEWLDLEHELGAVVMDGLMRSMFSEALTTDKLDEYVEGARDYGLYVIGRAMMYQLPPWLPRPHQKRGEAAKASMTAQLDAQVERRRLQGPRDPEDVLDALLAMEPHFPGDANERYRRMRSELSGLVFAGFETTAEALAWTLALLARNPHVMHKAYEEVDALGGEPLRYEHLERLTYLRACFDEAQRFQAAPGNIRTATQDDEIGGYFVPAGSHVMISPYGLHRDPRFWNDPGVFEPMRFLNDTINRNAFIPFNVGPRKCMGTRMAYIEGTLTLAAILQRYTIQVRNGWQPRHQLRVSTGLVGGLPARVQRR